MFTVYVLKSLKNGRYYTGSTNDLEKRLNEHNSRKSTYTKLTAPFMLVYMENYASRSDAVKREMFLKTGKGREWLKPRLSM